MLIHQTIAQGKPNRLVQGSLTEVVARDQWGVTIETHGFTDAGERMVLRVVMSKIEVDMIAGRQ